jgi:hypothetical protein
VLKSFEGGCPADVAGNLSEGPTLADPYVADFAIPEGSTLGKYTLACTWFNRLGSRELYMNCVPITITNGSSKGLPAVCRSIVPLFLPYLSSIETVA